MKILLTTLNSKYVHSNLAIKYLYSNAGEHWQDLIVKEFSINNDDDYIYTEIVRGKYDFVIFSCYIWNIDRILNLAYNVRKANPAIRIGLGGPEVSFDTSQIMLDNKYIEFIMAGEGEDVFPKLLHEIHEEHPDLTKIRGLTYRHEGKIYINPAAPLVDFSKVAFPYSKIPPEDDKVVYYESSRGCPFRCSYCLSCLDKSVRVLPMDRVQSDISYFLYKNVKQVKFVDRTFNWNTERCSEIIKFIKRADNGITNFHFEICADLVDENMLLELKNARKGLFQFEIGVQSTNPYTLEACNRKNDLLKLQYNVGVLKEFENIELHLDIIAGLPYEDFQTFQKTFNDVYNMNPDCFHVGFLKLLKGTPIRENAEEHRYIFKDKAPYEVISNQYISAIELIKIKMVEDVVSLYYNRGGFSNALKFVIENVFGNPFGFYEEFSDFYYAKGFQHKNQAKENLYRIFYAYAQWKEETTVGFKDIMMQLLKDDMEKTLNPEAIKRFDKKGWDIV